MTMAYGTAHRPRSWNDRPVLLGLVVAAVASFAAAAVGSAFTVTQIGSWYASIEKPSFTPPNAVFGPVWTVLYAMMAVAVWRAWWKGGDSGLPVRGALIAFGLQLILNAGWSIVFFGMEAPGPALFVIAALWLSILACIVLFWRLDRIAAWLMVPYLTWVSFASALNLGVWQLNP